MKWGHRWGLAKKAAQGPATLDENSRVFPLPENVEFDIGSEKIF